MNMELTREMHHEEGIPRYDLVFAILYALLVHPDFSLPLIPKARCRGFCYGLNL